MSVFTNGLKTAALLGLLMGLCLAVGSIWGRDGAIFGILLGGGMSVISYFFSDKIALASVGAHPITREEAPELYAITERLAQRANIPMPKLYYAPSEAPNAFATGRNPANGVVCVTAGIMRMLTARELEGVLAHELSHIKHRDILISTIAAVLAGAIGFVARMMFWFGGDGRRDREANPLGAIAVILTILLAPLAAMLIQMAISRSREFAADARGAQLASGPEGLINALRKLELGNRQIAMDISPSERHMFIVMPMLPSGESVLGLFRTHPPTEARIAALIKSMNQPNFFPAAA